MFGGNKVGLAKDLAEVKMVKRHLAKYNGCFCDEVVRVSLITHHRNTRAAEIIGTKDCHNIQFLYKWMQTFDHHCIFRLKLQLLLLNVLNKRNTGHNVQIAPSIQLFNKGKERDETLSVEWEVLMLNMRANFHLPL